MPPQIEPKRSPYRANRIGHATFTVGAEASNAVTVNVQLQDERRRDLAVRGAVLVFLSDDANGDSMTATAAAGGIAAGTDGHYTALVAGKLGFAVSEADGDLDLVVTHATGAKTYYLFVVRPDGGIIGSTVLTFA